MKVLLVCTSGGHFSTMRGLKSFWSAHDRVWSTDFKDDTSSLAAEEQVYWLPYQAPRNVWQFLKNIPASIRIVWREKPDVILSTGASIAVNFAIAAKLNGTRYIFVESISRSHKLSLAGQLVYYLSDDFYVQWPALAKKYSRARFFGLAI